MDVQLDWRNVEMWEKNEMWKKILKKDKLVGWSA